MKVAGLKTVFFYALLFLPLFLVGLFAVTLTAQIIRINRTDYRGLHAGLTKYLEADRGPLSARIADGRLVVRYDYAIKGGAYKPRELSFPFSPSGKEYTIYVYGSSPLVSRLPFVAADTLFPAQLQLKLDSRSPRRFQVHNFGAVSFDSFDIKKLVERTVSLRKPDLIVYYEGHMDYEGAYLSAIKRNFYLFNGSFFQELAGLASFSRNGRWNKIAELGDWFLRAHVEPGMLNLLQRAGLVKISEEAFAGFNAEILDAYEKNIRGIIDFAGSRGIPVVFVTPIANLEAQPSGIYRITQEYYDRGMKEKDRLRKIAWLRKAADSEIFTLDLRAKPGLNDFLRRLDSPGIYVLDLETELTEDGFPFDYRYFYDVSHIKPALHKIMADRIYDFLAGRGLLPGKEGQ